jgi:hypothetical protein
LVGAARACKRIAKQAVVAILLLAALGYAGACGYLWLQQRTLIYQPEAATQRTPRDVGIEFQALDIRIPGSGGLRVSEAPLARRPLE